MNRLTKQECEALLIVLALLLTGMVVKYYRMKHPATANSIMAGEVASADAMVQPDKN